MKTKQPVNGFAPGRGFTLLELMVSMAVTMILLGVVTYLTGMSSETYRESRDEVRSARQAKEALDAIGKDFEGMVARLDGNSYMWLYAAVEPKLIGDTVGSTTLVGPANRKITNASRLIFFTGAPDRYDGDIGGTGDNGGDVSAVGYRLVYRDQISGAAANQVGTYPVFTLYRHMVDPDATFTHVLGQADLSSPVSPAVNQFTDALDFMAENVIVENIYELTVTFIVQTDTGVKRFTIGQKTGTQQYHSFVIKGAGIISKADATSAEVAEDGQLAGVEISITVLTDRGLVLAQKSGLSRGDLIEEYGHHFTKTINVPRF